MKGVGNKLKL